MNYAVKLDEANFLEQAFQKDNKDLKNFTIQCWLKTTESGSVFQHHSQNISFSLNVASHGEVEFSVKRKEFEQTVKTLQGGINNGEWMYLVAVKHEDSLTITVNGGRVGVTQSNHVVLPEQIIKGIRIGKSSTTNTNDGFKGELGGITIWDKALSDTEIITHYRKPIVGNEEGILLNYPFKKAENHQRLSGEDDQFTVPLPLQTVELEVVNDSPHEFQLTDEDMLEYWPQTIHANKTTVLKFETSLPYFNSIAKYEAKEDENIITSLNIEVNKSLTFYKSFVQADISDDLDKQISVEKNTIENLIVSLRLSENLVIVNAKNLNQFLNVVIPKLEKEQVVTSMNYDETTGKATSSGEQIVRYNQSAQVFNRRIQKKPLAIIYCKNSDDVQLAYNTAIENNLPIKVRSGGHDHEGECTGTNVILIDLIGLNQLDIFEAYSQGVVPVNIAAIGPGNRFNALTPALALENRMIPHGTCATVAIPGFTMGGGWGPWTRSQGMCCEHLVGAEIILGNGTKEIIASETITNRGDGRDIIVLKKNKPELLWALKGGGGMSYGIVTKLYIKTFKLKRTLIKFELEWNRYDDNQVLHGHIPTIQILKRWEEIIESDKTGALTGTNLKINGKPLKIIGYKDEAECFPIYDSLNTDTVTHNCVMYGYWEGDTGHLETLKILNDFIKAEFTDYDLKPDKKQLDGIGGLGGYEPQLGKWDRESHSQVKLRAQANGEDSTPYPPDLDDPAPHKITSRLVDPCGLGDEGYKQLLSSLTSPLILDGNREDGLFTYVTLGAIVGNFYNTIGRIDNSSFPYKDKKYTIQYQTWWNLELAEKEKLQDNKVYTRINRALDWMEESRDFKIENTSGAFISFKDNSIPTETYFAQNYDRLKCIKEHYSKDPNNHLRSRKTII